MSTLAQRSLESLHSNLYGVSIYEASPISVIWAAERMAKNDDVTSVIKALRAVNRKREKMGKMPAYPPFGSAIF
jgi:hypothetical protein